MAERPEEPKVIYARNACNYDLLLNTKLEGLHIDSICKIDSFFSKLTLNTKNFKTIFLFHP